MKTHAKSFRVDSTQPMKHYDALQDKFASCYFNGVGLKKHLRKLKKAIDLEPRKKGHQYYSSLLNQKLEEIQKEDDIRLKNKIEPYEQSLKLTSLQQLKQTHKQLSAKQQQNRRKIVSERSLPDISKNEGNKKRSPTLQPNQQNRSKTSIKRGVGLSAYGGRSGTHLKKVSGLKKQQQNPVKHTQFVSFLNRRKQEVIAGVQSKLEGQGSGGQMQATSDK